MTDLFDVGVVGTGYVGLTTGACLAHMGHRVTCVDNNARLVAELGEGRIPFYEPGLEELVERDVRDGRLHFSTDLAPLVGEADIVFIAVGTPQGEDGSADLDDVAAVARGVGRALSEVGTSRDRPLVVVNKSTVPVGSGDYVSMLIQEGIDEAEGGRAGSSGEGVELEVASNPEFLREGSAIYDSLFPDRIVVGADSREALDTLRALYEPIIEQGFPTEFDPRPNTSASFGVPRPSSASPRAVTWQLAAAGSATGAPPTSRRADPSLPRRPASATCCRRARACSPSRIWRRP